MLYRNASGVIAQTETAKKVLSVNTKNKNIRANIFGQENLEYIALA